MSNAFHNWVLTTDTGTAWPDTYIINTSSMSLWNTSPPAPRITELQRDIAADKRWVVTEYLSKGDHYVTRWIGEDWAEYSRKSNSREDALAFHRKWVQTNVMSCKNNKLRRLLL